MSAALTERVDKMIGVYQQLKERYKWKADDMTLRFSAMTLSLSDRTFDIEKFDRALDEVKKNSGFFSYYRSTLLYAITAQLTSHFDDPGQVFPRLLEYDRLLRDNGFKNSVHLGIAAFALLITCSGGDAAAIVDKARVIYAKMKENHYWLTSTDDYALAVLLAGEKEPADTLVNRMEEHFDSLHQAGFHRNNGLQFLSHMLAFSSAPVDEKVRLCTEIMEFLKERRLKLSSTYYGAIGLLALLNDLRHTSADGCLIAGCRDALNAVADTVDYLKQQKHFKWVSKELMTLMCSVLAGFEFVEEKNKLQNLGTTSMGITLQALIAAQNAAMVAAVSVAVTTTINTNSST